MYLKVLMEKFLQKHYRWIVGVILAFMFVVSTLNANNDSATFDEVAHIPASYSYVTQHDTRLNPEHPPLIKDMAGLPLLFLNLKFDTTEDFWTGKLPNLWDEGQWTAGHHLLYEAGNNPDQIIFWARMPIVLLSLILGLFLFKWGKEIAGTSAGIFALLLYAFDPNILGHNHFVTTDLGIAAFFTFAFYFFLKFIKHPSWKNVLLGGIFLGLLLVSKFSSIVALPVFGLTLFIYALVKNNREGENNWKTRLINLGKYLLKGLAAFAVAAVVIWIVYEANIYKMPSETFAKTIDFFFAADDTNLKASITNKTLHALNQSNLTRPWATYMFGPAWMFKRVSGGNGAYFLGQVGNGFTSYFPTVFAIKETLPFLILALFALLFTLKQSLTSIAKNILNFGQARAALAKFLRSSVSFYTMFIFIVLYAFLSITGGLNIGFRHLFPILPFAYLLITHKVFDFLRNKHVMTKRAFWLPASVLIAWIVLIPVLNYPSYTSYFNESIGGSQNGYKYVTDSNTDWGQDLKRLNVWINEHNRKAWTINCSSIYPNPTDCLQIDRIRVDYFGGGNPKLVLGDKYVQWWDSMRPVEKGWYALSTNFTQGSIYSAKNTPANNYAWTLNYKPVTMIGKSILIYYIENPPKE